MIGDDRGILFIGSRCQENLGGGRVQLVRRKRQHRGKLYPLWAQGEGDALFARGDPDVQKQVQAALGLAMEGGLFAEDVHHLLVVGYDG
jgi:hypothetical protein